MDGGLKAGIIFRHLHSHVWRFMPPVSWAVGWDTCGLSLWARLGFLTAWRLGSKRQ